MADEAVVEESDEGGSDRRRKGLAGAVPAHGDVERLGTIAAAKSYVRSWPPVPSIIDGVVGRGHLALLGLV